MDKQREEFEALVLSNYRYNSSYLKRNELIDSIYQYESIQFAYECFCSGQASKQSEIDELKAEQPQGQWIIGFQLFSEVGFPPPDTEVICGWFGVDGSELDYMAHDEDLNPYWANSKDGYDFWAHKPKPPGSK